MKRKLCFALAVLMILSAAAVFTSCNNSANDPAATTVTTLPSGAGNGGGVIEKDLFEDLPSGSYEGYNFQFLNNTSNYAITTIVP
ncbi:MAG: hypothetical protein J6Q77_03160, partial [Clostridia bacterium]|nr:hypothetical protein [Clostridia bacterium]